MARAVLLGPSNGARVTWGTIQERAGLSRAEGAFGHSIALGSTLAMTAVLTLQARLPAAIRLILIGLMVGGIAVSLSRGSLVCLGLGLGLALLFVPDHRVRELRPAVAVTAVGGLALLAPWVLGSSRRQARRRAGALPTAATCCRCWTSWSRRAFGRDPGDSAGNTYIDGFRSIDNQMLIFGLNFGWLMITVVVALLVLAGLAIVSGRATLPWSRWWRRRQPW